MLSLTSKEREFFFSTMSGYAHQVFGFSSFAGMKACSEFNNHLESALNISPNKKEDTVMAGIITAFLGADAIKKEMLVDCTKFSYMDKNELLLIVQKSLDQTSAPYSQKDTMISKTRALLGL